jgi:hypothetical protein
MATRPKLTSEARSHWDGRILEAADGLEILIDGRPLQALNCPTLDSLERRHAASDQAWVEPWLADEADPTQPE